jgi:hypothetical protein
MDVGGYEVGIVERGWEAEGVVNGWGCGRDEWDE